MNTSRDLINTLNQQTLDQIRRTQDAVVEAVRSLSERTPKVGSLPDSPVDADRLVDSAFGFAHTVLDMNHRFAHRLLSVGGGDAAAPAPAAETPAPAKATVSRAAVKEAAATTSAPQAPVEATPVPAPPDVPAPVDATPCRPPSRRLPSTRPPPRRPRPRRLRPRRLRPRRLRSRRLRPSVLRPRRLRPRRLPRPSRTDPGYRVSPRRRPSWMAWTARRAALASPTT